jgi:TonB-dependent SusC/RagA subfamily outer membrane receptor
MKRLLLFFFVFWVFLLLATAQQKTITGTVTGANDNLPIIGATVQIKGTTTGVATDLNGKYQISVPAGASLEIRFLGMRTKEVVVGTSNIIDVVMEPNVLDLEEVVVTALGISRERKSLGYATQEVKGDVVTSVKTANFMNNLSGKLSGVQVQRNQNMGGSTNVIVRGSKSFVNSNQVLYVVDGVPINNQIGKYTDVGVTSGQAATVAGYDYGNAAADIDPESIESINVLKGAAATALYGSRASAGVIMITTKKGKILGAGRSEDVV